MLPGCISLNHCSDIKLMGNKGDDGWLFCCWRKGGGKAPVRPYTLLYFMATSFMGWDGDVTGPSLQALDQGAELRGEALGCKSDREPHVRSTVGLALRICL